jgi:hypothetical protein
VSYLAILRENVSEEMEFRPKVNAGVLEKYNVNTGPAN